MSISAQEEVQIRKSFKYGVLPDWPDEDRWIAGDPRVIPHEVDFWREYVPAWNQGLNGACVSFSYQKAFEGQWKVHGYTPMATSQRFAYCFARAKDDDEGLNRENYLEQHGTTLAAGAWVQRSLGNLPYGQWPFVFGDKEDPGFENAIRFIMEARQRRIKAYRSLAPFELTTPEIMRRIKGAISELSSCVVGLRITAGWFDPKEGIITEKGPVLANHAVCFCGYDDTTGLFHGINSWGAGYGVQGFFYYPYSFMQEHLLGAYRIEIA